ncbi:hypothetical protein [Jiangella endophytica]|uniref:hypothetical protein n=1 Tax=Jiangella endophytica TaxID=1623398 RepID=UPI0013002B06|nr:hypothetical protein [Jiangella endophytica]
MDTPHHPTSPHRPPPDRISGYPSVFDWDGGTGPGSNFDLFTDGGRGYLYFRTSVAYGHTQINRIALEITNY